MFLLGILAAVAGIAVIRTQVKDRDSTKIKKNCRQKTEGNVFLCFSVFLQRMSKSSSRPKKSKTAETL